MRETSPPALISDQYVAINMWQLICGKEGPSTRETSPPALIYLYNELCGIHMWQGGGGLLRVKLRHLHKYLYKDQYVALICGKSSICDQYVINMWH